MEFKAAKYEQKYRNQLLEIWKENKYQIQSGLDYIHFLFFIYGRPVLIIILLFVYVCLSHLLYTLSPSIFVPGSYKMLASLILLCSFYIFKVVHWGLKRKFEQKLKIDQLLYLNETNTSNNKETANIQNSLNQKLVLKLKDKVLGSVNILQLNEYGNYNKKIQKVIQNMNFNRQIFILDSFCVTKKDGQENLQKMIKEIIKECELKILDHIKKQCQQNNGQNSQFVIALPIQNMNLFDIKFLQQDNGFVRRKSVFSDIQEILFGVSTMIMIKNYEEK